VLRWKSPVGSTPHFLRGGKVMHLQEAGAAEQQTMQVGLPPGPGWCSPCPPAGQRMARAGKSWRGSRRANRPFLYSQKPPGTLPPVRNSSSCNSHKPDGVRLYHQPHMLGSRA